MQEMIDTAAFPGDDITEEDLHGTNPDQDGRNKEWQDRARVNLEQTPEGVHTSVERDFEPEKSEEDDKTRKETPPAY